MSNADLSGTPFEVLDKRFAGLVNGVAKLERLYTGCRWAEGPAYFAAGKYLLWSDIPNNRIMRWDETDGTTSVFRQPSNNTNGHTVDRQGRLISCEHLGRRVSRTEFDGSITVLADRYQGKKLNSPNDVVVKSDHSIWFTDPAYGIDWDYEGERSESEIGRCNVYRIDPQSGEVSLVADDFERPNGLAFSPDESKLYIADTGATHVENGPRHIRVFDVVDGKVTQGRRSLRHLHGGLVRRLQAGRRRPDLDISGGRRALLPPRWHAHREDSRAGSGRECLLWRAPP